MAFGNENKIVDLNGVKSKNSVEIFAKFLNASKQNVNIFWLDYKGQEKLYSNLSEGKVYNCKTYAHHPWIVRPDSGEEDETRLMPLEINSDNSHVWTPTVEEGDADVVTVTIREEDGVTSKRNEIAEEERATKKTAMDLTIYDLGDLKSEDVSEETVKTTFTNVSQHEVQLFWVDYEGRGIHYADLNRGERFGCDTYVSHPWIARRKKNDENSTDSDLMGLEEDGNSSRVWVPGHNHLGVNDVIVNIRESL